MNFQDMDRYVESHRIDIGRIALASFFAGMCIGLGVWRTSEGAWFNAAALFIVAALASWEVSFLASGKHRTWSKTMELGHKPEQVITFNTRRRWVICGIFGWHGKIQRSGFDGASWHARCGKCGFPGLIDSHGQLF